MPVQRWSDRIWVAHLTGQPEFGSDVDYLLRHASDDGHHADVVLDLSGIETINSHDLSHLLRLRKALHEHGARLRLTAPSDRIWAVFLAAGLDGVFSFQSDTSTALAELQLDPGRRQ